MSRRKMAFKESALRERVKELTCLYAIAQISSTPTASMDEILQGVVDVLPPAWVFSNLAAAQIVLDDTVYSSGNRVVSGPGQESALIVRGVNRGVVRIRYPAEDYSTAIPPFVQEEQALLDEVARQISIIVDRREAVAEQGRLEAKLRHADRLATIGQLAAGVAHELNEPLGAILGFAQLLTKTPHLTEQARKDIGKIEASALHARAVIRQLMTFARQTTARDTCVNINRLVQESAGIWLHRCEAEGVRIEYALDDSLPEIVGDDGQLRQVVTNLVVNAVQAMPEGGVLRIETAREDNALRVVISDTGLGIPPDNLPRLFDPFFTTKDVDQGTGLGLAVVHGIVTGHQGKIAVESVPGRGTRITVLLPINRPPGDSLNPGGGDAKA